MRNVGAVVFALLAGSTLAMAGALPARPAPCPENELHVHGAVIVTTAAAYDTLVGPGLGGAIDNDGYDLAAGRLELYHPGGLSPTSVHIADLYDVWGAAPGTEVPVTVELTVTGWIATDGCGGSGCWGTVSGKVETPSDMKLVSASPTIYGAGKVPFSFVVSAQAVLTAGTQTPIAFEIVGSRPPGGAHYSDASARFRFEGLPPGLLVTSCQGYADPAIPARRSSWGGIKASYR